MDLIDELISACRESAPSGQGAVHEVVTSALADHERFEAAIAQRPQPWFFAADDAITVFATAGRPGSASAPHNHGVWSVLGCFAGAEESWWHAVDADRVATVRQSILRAGEVHSLPDSAVHSVMNRWDVPNAIVHVYGGNFLAADRRIWDPVTGEEHMAGLAEPYAPLRSGSPMQAAMSSPAGSSVGLAGTAFAALAVDGVEVVAAWLGITFGLNSFTSNADTCAIDEEFVYLVEPSSLTAIGVHRRSEHSMGGLDHLALRVSGVDALHRWHRVLTDNGSQPSPITTWKFGTFVEVIGPESVKVRLFVPEMR